MKKERRNYYRILHVQPEAPTEIITACYRSMMTKLRHHPDLGGDHDTAVLINQAYAVLSDPEKRKAYDLVNRIAHKSTIKPDQTSNPPKPQANSTKQHSTPFNATLCPFCTAQKPTIIAARTRCSRCDSPLAPIANRLNGKRELLGKRTALRVNKTDLATLYRTWGKPSARARLRDLSTTGISFYTAAEVTLGSIVRITTMTIDGLVKIVEVRSKEQIYIVHAQILTACFANQSGVFVSMSI